MSEEKNPVFLGDVAYDTVTGFRGVVIARCLYIDGTESVELQPIGEDKKTLLPSQWLPITRVKAEI